MTPDERDVERVAEELWQADSERAAGCRRRVAWAECPEPQKWRLLAHAAITAYREALVERGMVVVPMEPTSEMTAPLVAPGDDRTAVIRIYRAMISAYEGESR